MSYNERNDLTAQRLANLWNEMNNRHEKEERVDKNTARIRAALAELNKAHGIA